MPFLGIKFTEIFDPPLNNVPDKHFKKKATIGRHKIDIQDISGIYFNKFSSKVGSKAKHKEVKPLPWKVGFVITGLCSASSKKYNILRYWFIRMFTPQGKFPFDN